MNTVAKQSKCLMQNIRMEYVYVLLSYRHKGQGDITLLFGYTLIIIIAYIPVLHPINCHILLDTKAMYESGNSRERVLLMHGF